MTMTPTDQRPQECEHYDTFYNACYCIFASDGDYCPDFTPKQKAK